MILRFLSSLRLTLFLLLSLALVSILGTLNPPVDGRYDLFYQSLWFRLLLSLLAVNLAVCTVKTVRRNLADRRRYMEILQSEQVFAGPLRYVLPRDVGTERLAKGLQRLGYRLFRQGDHLVARRGLVGRWGSTIVHLSVLAVMLGALTAELGFVGTLNIYVGDKSSVYFDWAKQRELPLGFEFRLDRFEPLYYPIELRFAAVEPRTGEVITTYTTREGEAVTLPGSGLTARVLKFLPEEEHLILGIYRQGVYLGDYHALGGKKSVDNTIDPGFELRPVAYRDPILKQLHSEVSILEGGEVVSQGVIEVNRPLVHDGIAVYQTAYDRDKFGFWFAGFQFTRDPGKPMVWAACIFLVLGLLVAFSVPYRAVGVTRIDDGVLLVALTGFRGEGGVENFDRLERMLANFLEDNG
jgi:cytochrome c biogenesis protein